MRKIFPILLICLIGCATSFNKDQYIPESVVLKEEKIIVNGKAYARLIFIEKHGNSDWCRGIAIHYLATNRYEWISPKKGWKLQENAEIHKDIPIVAKLWGTEAYGRYRLIKGTKSVAGDSYFKLEWRGGVKLSEDLKFILYKESSLFGPKDRKYRIRF